MSSGIRSVAIAACAATLACATGQRARTAPEPQRIDVGDGETIEGDASAAMLAGKNDAELFAIASAATQRGDHALAAAAFSRLAAAYPASPQAVEARYRAGLAYRQLGRWELALEGFREVAAAPPNPYSEEAEFLVAEALYHLGRSAEAIACLDRIASRPGVGPLDRARALTQRAVLELEAGDADRAERSLQLAVATGGSLEGLRPEERYYLAKARFLLGEVARSRFEEVKLDPAHATTSELAAKLEDRASLLLVAQERYVDAIRAGDAEWAVAAGSRVGELYEELQRDMTEAPLPPSLAGEAARTYRHELRQRVRVLVTKAIDAYDETLAAARRTRVESTFVERTQAALERMQRVLAETDAADGT